MTISEAIATAHIHLDSATFRVYVKDSGTYPIELMNQTCPDWVLWISKSDKKDYLLITLIEGYDLRELAEWVKGFEIN